MTWRIKGCPHCGGDVFLDKDVNHVWVENCLQCGYDAVLKEVDSKQQVVKPAEKPDVLQTIRYR